jgi:hypothetical protein
MKKENIVNRPKIHTNINIRDGYSKPPVEKLQRPKPTPPPPPKGTRVRIHD